MESLGPPPVDRGRVFIYWILEGIAAIFAIALLFALVPLTFSPNNTRVDPATVPAGKPYYVIVNATGPAAYYTCPSLRDWYTSDQDKFCADAMSSTTTGLVLTAVGAIVAVGLFFWLRRLRLREKYRAATWTEPQQPVLEYRQSGMPFAYWLAFALVGALELLMVGATIVSLWAGKPVALMGPLFYGFILYLIVWVHGFKRAYRVRLAEDSVIWTTPLRTRSVPLRRVSSADVPTRGTMSEPERIGKIRLANGGELRVNLPDDYRRWQFACFCETLRGQGIEVVHSDD